MVLAALLWFHGSPVAGAEDAGRLRVAHLSPDTPAVDVAVAPVPPGSDEPLTDPGTDLAAGLSYGEISDVADLPAGTWAVSVRAAGSDRSVPPVLSARVEVTAGATWTVTVAGRFADLALRSAPEDLTAPLPGTARVRVVAAAGGVPALDVSVRGGPVLATALPFGATGDRSTVRAGSATLTVGGGGAAPAEVPASFPAGSVVTLLVLDAPGGGLTVRPVVDAAGPVAVPSGGVAAGFGAVAGGPAVLITTGVALAGAALAGLAAGRRGRALLAVTALAVGTAGATPAGASAPASRPVVVAAPAEPSTPVRLVVPAAGVDAPLAGVGLGPAGALAPPADAAVAGWYTGGPVPGATGPAVVAGHVDWAGDPGVFAGLAGLRPGAEVLVHRADGSTARFTVTRVVRAPKDGFPTGVVYGPTASPELRLITCGGAFDRATGSYEDNVIVFAR